MEVESLLPVMLEAVKLIGERRVVDAFIIQAPTISSSLLDATLAAAGSNVRIADGEGRAALAGSDIAICSSGTATLEAALLSVPAVVVYKLSGLTYALGRLLVRLPHFSLVNIIAGKAVVPELLQGQVTASRIASSVLDLLEPATYATTIGELERVRTLVGGPGAAHRAAEKIITLMRAVASEKAAVSSSVNR